MTRYYGNVLPYYNGQNLDDDYLLYNISFDALEEQPTIFCCEIVFLLKQR